MLPSPRTQRTTMLSVSVRVWEAWRIGFFRGIRTCQAVNSCTRMHSVLARNGDPHRLTKRMQRLESSRGRVNALETGVKLVARRLSVRGAEGALSRLARHFHACP